MTKLKKVEAEGADSDKVESIRFEFLLTPPTLQPDFPRSSSFFKDGSPEEYIRWFLGYCDLELLIPLIEPSDRTHMLRTMLKGWALPLFEYHVTKDVVVKTLKLRIKSC
jgi:hypothetical protein